MDHFVPLSSASLERVRNVAKATAERHHLLLSRIGLLDDHLHLIVGIPATLDPCSVVLSFMNNTAWVFGLQPVLWHSCYVGTIGEYDLGAVQDP
jgi:REP element-mobilizing transposase RayT